MGWGAGSPWMTERVHPCPLCPMCLPMRCTKEDGARARVRFEREKEEEQEERHVEGEALNTEG